MTWLVVLAVIVVIVAIALIWWTLRRPAPEPVPLESGVPREAIKRVIERRTRS